MVWVEEVETSRYAPAAAKTTKKKSTAKKAPPPLPPPTPKEQSEAELVASAKLKETERNLHYIQAEAEAQNANLVHKASARHAEPPPRSSSLDIAHDLRQELEAQKRKRENASPPPAEQARINFPGAPQVKLVGEVTQEEAEAFTPDQRARLHALLSQRASALQEEIAQLQAALQQCKAQAKARSPPEALS